MISVESSFYDRFPRFAVGRARSITQPVVEVLRKVMCEERINRTLDALEQRSGLDFVEQALRDMGVSYQVGNTDRENIPAEGRVIIVANHPLGALDALALIDLVASVRRDVRVLANGVLMSLEGLRPLLVSVPVFGGGSALATLREARRVLQADAALIVFPSGVVSRLGTLGLRDPRWSPGFAWLASNTQSPVLPIHIAARNSAMFYGVSMVAPPLSTLLLPREMFAAAQTRIGFAVGEMIAARALTEAEGDPHRLARRMRAHVYRLPQRRAPLFATMRAIAHPQPLSQVRAALRAAEVLGSTRDGKRILLLGARADCPALREIGRLRELSFRRVGEGSGLRRDLDRYDAWYRHIVLWDDDALMIVGAYRLAEGASVLRERGLGGLYSASLFDYADAAHDFIAEGVELGRSFVHPAYWGSRSLDYLWQGIGAYLRSRPQVRYLFGPVSLSAALPKPARDWIVAIHRHYFPAPRALALARQRYEPDAAVTASVRSLVAEHPSAVDGLRYLQQRLAELGSGLPVLFRQYVELAEPEGVAFLDFGVDPAFAGCVDGLIRIDLQRLRPAKRARYLGDGDATRRHAALPQ